MDNVFVIAMIFGYFAIPRALQHRRLFWGILGVIVLRAIMIGAGAALVSRYGWVLYLFAAFLVFTGIKMFFAGDGHADVGANPMVKWMRGHLRITDQLHGQKFFVRQPHPKTGRRILWATPMFLALVMIEIGDVIFAVDSVPAIFAITTDLYIVYTSNIFAILGLRALYFALAAIIHPISDILRGVEGGAGMSGFTEGERRTDPAQRAAEEAQRVDKLRHAKTYLPAADDPFCMICNLQFPSYQTNSPDTPICESCF